MEVAEAGRTTAATLATLQIGNDWPGQRVGGLNRYFSELVRHLPATGTSVQAMVVGPSEIYDQTKGVVTPFALPDAPIAKRIYQARRTALDKLRGGEIDLIAAHFALYAPPLGPFRKIPPMVVHFHGPWAAESNVERSLSVSTRVKHAVEDTVYRRAARFIVLSQSFQRELVEHYGVAESLVSVIPGGIDLQRFNCASSRAEARQRLGWATDRPTLLAVRRLVRRMGLEVLIEAMLSVVARVPDVKLYIGGSGPLSGELQAQIAAKGLDRNVSLLGRLSEADLPVAYRAADMTVVPTQFLEGFGMITLESLASGTPTLVTPVGGLPEILEPFAPQCIFASVEAQAISDLLIDALCGSRFLPADAACRAYAERYAWPRIASLVRQAYDLTLTHG